MLFRLDQLNWSRVLDRFYNLFIIAYQQSIGNLQAKESSNWYDISIEW